MGQELNLLLGTAASIGFIHTLFGPDHYIPFVMMAKARQWSNVKTTWITLVCGIGHVASSVILGLIGITVGVALTSLETIESMRGEIAGWFLIAFGLVYFIWGVRQAYKKKSHSHTHLHTNGTAHAHEHTHSNNHTHVHDEKSNKKEITPWILFTIFLLGPCEPLIPLLMYPAAKNSWSDVLLVTGTFGVVTIATMIGTVFLLIYGAKYLPQKLSLEKYIHPVAGATILICGVAIRFLGL